MLGCHLIKKFSTMERIGYGVNHHRAYVYEEPTYRERTMTSNDLTEVSSKDDRNIAALTHAGGILFGFIPGLIVYLIKKDGGPVWLVQQSKEALNFQMTVLIAYVVATALSALMIGLILFPPIFLVNLIFCILAAIKASQGEVYRYPLALRLLS